LRSCNTEPLFCSSVFWNF